MLLDLLGAPDPLIANHFDNTARWFDRLIAAGQPYLRDTSHQTSHDLDSHDLNSPDLVPLMISYLS